MTQHRIIGIAGWKNSGKTMMTAALVAELSARGRTVSTVKHAHHDFDIDREGTDSWKHRRAGAGEVAIVSRRRWALMHEAGPDEDEPPLAEIVAKLAPCDIVIVEGYKRDTHPKIEIRRKDAEGREPLSSADANVIAVVSDDPEEETEGLPLFSHEDIGAIADFVERVSGLA